MAIIIRRSQLAAVILLVGSLWLMYNFWRSSKGVGGLESPQVFEDANVVLGEISGEHIAVDEVPSMDRAAFADALEGLMRPLEKDDEMAAHNRQTASHNRKTFWALMECLYASNCEPNQSKLVVMDSQNFHHAHIGGRSGEQVWPASVTHALDALGVSYVYSPQNTTWASALHGLFPKQVKAIFLEPKDVENCFEVSSKCVQSDQNPKGIPAHKIFAWTWFDSATMGSLSANPLGKQWTVTPEIYDSGATYIGYSIEHKCRASPYVKPAQRKDRAWIHANLETYFWKTHNIWPPTYFERSGRDSGMEFMAALDPDDARLINYPETHGAQAVPKNLVEIPTVSQEKLYDILSHSKLMIGLWDPRELPIVYEGLCLGVPFLNPIRDWDTSNATDRSQWGVQNTWLKNLGPPYVYNVFRGDEEGFMAAVANAKAHPLSESFVPGHMRESAITARLNSFMNRDWESEAASALATRGTVEAN